MTNQKRSLVSSRLQKSLKRKTIRRRLVRYGLVAANVAVLGIVALFVLSGEHDASLTATSTLSDNSVTDPVDNLTAYDIAANVARMADLPEATPIENQAQSAEVTVAVSANSSAIAAKPQIVYTALKSRYDIQTYVAEAGDTVTTIAQKFGLTTNSIIWSNNLSNVNTAIPLGTKLSIPPVNGIVYTVQSGDTVQSLATKYSVAVDQIVAYNDAEISGIWAGEQLLIPNGQVQAPVVAASTFSSSSSDTSLLTGNYTPIYGDNGYDFGTCTWYVASQISVPNNWGNADTWAYYAALSGWNVSSTPTVGAIAQTSGMSAWGHVGIVTGVNGDGTITVTDMNDPYWDRVTTHTFPVSEFQHYITQ
jgi:surface antigen